jgi:S1-C subfamily serine protease
MSLRWSLVVGLCLVGLLLLPALATAGTIGVQIKKDDGGKGLLVVAVVGDSPAEKAGVKMDDIITHADGEAVGDLMSFVEKVRGIKAGETLKLKVLRGDKEMEIKVTVGES